MLSTPVHLLSTTIHILSTCKKGIHQIPPSKFPESHLTAWSLWCCHPDQIQMPRRICGCGSSSMFLLNLWRAVGKRFQLSFFLPYDQHAVGVKHRITTTNIPILKRGVGREWKAQRLSPFNDGSEIQLGTSCWFLDRSSYLSLSSCFF